MNCPGHCLIFVSKTRSYRDLPIRYADFSALHRNEISGALSGTMKLEMADQPEATKEYATEVLKGTLDREEHNSRGIEMSGKDGRKHFEALIERYL
jgi:hypothetical protein